MRRLQGIYGRKVSGGGLSPLIIDDEDLIERYKNKTPLVAG